MKVHNNKLLRYNLQLFAGGTEGSETGGGDAINRTDLVSGVMDIFNSQEITEPSQGAEDTGEIEDISQPTDEGQPSTGEEKPTPEQQDTRTEQFDMEQFRAQMEDNIIQKMREQQNSETPTEVAEGEQKTPEELRQELVDKMLNNPEEAVMEIIQQYEAQKQAELQVQQEKQQEFTNAANEFMQAHPDYAEVIDQMQEIITSNDFLQNNPKGFETAYFMAKGKAYQKPQSFEEMLQDQSNIEKLMKNADYEKRFVEQYMKKRANGEPPITIDKTTGGQSASTPPEEIKSSNQLKQAVLSMFK